MMPRRILVAPVLVLLVFGAIARAAPKNAEREDEARQAEEAARLNARFAELVRAGNYADCEPVLKKLLKLNPKDNLTWYNLACVYSQLGRKKEALAALAAAIKAGWRDVEHMDRDEDLAAIRKTREYLLLRAILQQAKQRPTTGPARRPPGAPPITQPAQARLRQIMALRRQAVRHFGAKQYEKARAVIHQILELAPDSAVDWYNLACAHARMRNIPEAIACLNFAVTKGYSSFRHMERDPDLQALRATRGYQELLVRRDAIQRARAEKILKALREKYGIDYICEIDHERKMVFATNIDRKILDELKEHLTRYASAQWKELFTHPFEEYITIVVPKKWTGLRVGGYYNHAARVLMCRSIGMVLTHEFTHALHFADMEGIGQRHPIWIIEGLATLFETSKLVNGRAVPEPNHRLNQVQGFIRARRTMPLRELVKLSHPNFVRKASVAYAQARYVMVYLYEKGLLREWYDTYTRLYEKDRTGARALVEVCGKELDEIESDWRNWVLAKKPLMLRLPADHAYLGINVEAAKDGVRVATVVPGSGADKAGLKLGDVIVRIDAERLIDPLDLIRLVGTHKVGDKVEVHFRRDGKYQTVAVTLQPLPAEFAARRPRTPSRRRPTTRPARQRPRPTTGPAPGKRQPASPAPSTRPAAKKTRPAANTPGPSTGPAVKPKPSAQRPGPKPVPEKPRT